MAKNDFNNIINKLEKNSIPKIDNPTKRVKKSTIGSLVISLIGSLLIGGAGTGYMYLEGKDKDTIIENKQKTIETVMDHSQKDTEQLSKYLTKLREERDYNESLNDELKEAKEKNINLTATNNEYESTVKNLNLKNKKLVKKNDNLELVEKDYAEYKKLMKKYEKKIKTYVEENKKRKKELGDNIIELEVAHDQIGNYFCKRVCNITSYCCGSTNYKFTDSDCKKYCKIKTDNSGFSTKRYGVLKKPKTDQTKKKLAKKSK
ncbi:hypothetical protein HON01_03335 [Candidatus Woesearchaeota archaeon]|jgi:hypothetical protein|nr:hypothetical protein [Candidatus Woesearchaeota archaeon]MBT7367430.1 hypothetical protein [Candidatus Woesearchaeota archaeon]